MLGGFQAVNQFEYHVGMGADPEGLRTYCQSKGIAAQAYSPLGPTFSQKAKDIIIKGNLTNSIGKEHNKTGAQVGLKFIVQHNVSLVTRALDEDYLLEDIDLWGFNLTASDMQRLEAATEPKASPCLLCHSKPAL